MNITEKDVGRKVLSKSGGAGRIIRFRADRTHPVLVEFEWGLRAYTELGWYSEVGPTQFDLECFVHDVQENEVGELNITEVDVGKLFKTRDGGVRKVIYIHPDGGYYPGPVVAINTDTGRAFNFQLNGWFLRSEASEYDLVERYDPMTWEEFCENVIHWATDRRIIANSTPCTQVMKGLTEYGKLVEAVLNDERDEVVDAIGDILVCLVNAATIADRDLSSARLWTVPLTTPAYSLAGTAEVLGKLLLSVDNSDYGVALWRIQELAKALEVDFRECLEAAWNAIKDRRGYLNEQGVFVKESGND